MKITLITLLIFTFNVHAVRLTETKVQTITITTEQTFSNEEDALEAAFGLEDELNNYRSEEFSKLKKECDNFISLLKPTTVRLETGKDQKLKGVIHARIRCLR